jgi:hypothetical protein
MPCNFDSIEEFRVLDRLLLPLPNGHPPMWRLHVVQLTASGDRVYNFVGSSTPTSRFTVGCFALYPDDVMRTAADTADWCNGAWPLLRHTPGPFQWHAVNLMLSEWVNRLGLFELNDIRMLPWSCDAWSVRYDEGPHIVRRFAWFGSGEKVPTAWFILQAYCTRLAEQSLRATPSGRRP